MVTLRKDVAKQLYRSVFAELTGDADLTLLLGADASDKKVYQSFIDFNTMAEFKGPVWITFNVAGNAPMDIEQMQDVHNFLFDVHIWQRGPGSDKSEDVEALVRTVLDNAALSTDMLFCWYCHFAGYRKTYEALPELHHITSTYTIMCMAVEPEA